MISAKELYYFTEVANCENMSRAAERIGIAQPSLSSSIKKLEQYIGVDLLVRHKTGITLTQAGKQLLTHAKQMQQYWDDVKTKALMSHHEICGSFIFGCHPSVGLSHIPNTLSKIIAENNNLELEIKYDLSRNITEAIINSKIDIGVVVNPVKHNDLVLIKLKNDRVAIWHNFSEDEIKKSKHALIADKDLIQANYIYNKFDNGSEYFDRIIRSSNLEVNTKLAVNKVGFAILPETVVKSTAGNTLKILANSPIYKDEIYIALRPENKKIKAIQSIIQYIKNDLTEDTLELV